MSMCDGKVCSFDSFFFKIHVRKLSLVPYYRSKLSSRKILMDDVFVWYGTQGNIAETLLMRQVNQCVKINNSDYSPNEQRVFNISRLILSSKQFYQMCEKGVVFKPITVSYILDVKSVPCKFFLICSKKCRTIKLYLKSFSTLK